MKNTKKINGMRNWIFILAAVIFTLLPNEVSVKAETILGEISANETFTPEYAGYYSLKLDTASKVELEGRLYSVGIYRADTWENICPDFDDNVEWGYNNAARLAAGKYAIYLNDNVTYCFHVTPEAGTNYEQESNDSFDTANQIDTNISYTGSINGNDDYYKFNLSQPGKVNISFSNGADTQNSGKIELYSEDNNSNTSLLLRQSVNGTSNSSTFRLPAKNYYLVVKSTSEKEDYHVRVNFTPETADSSEVENNDTLERANVIKPNILYSGNIEFHQNEYELYQNTGEEDIDYFKITLDTTGTARLHTQIPRQTKNGLFKVSLYKEEDRKNACDTLKTSSNPVSYGNEKTLSAGTYYIVVEGNERTDISGIDYNIGLDFEKTSLVTSISLKGTKEEYYVKDTDTITANIEPTDASIKDLNWSSSAQSVVKVDSSGKITCVGKGKAYVTAKAKDNSGKEAKLLIEVKDHQVESIKVTAEKNVLSVGETIRLNATVLPSNASNKSFYWSSSNADVASVTNGGNVKAKKVGKATISAISEDGSKVKGSIVITVSEKKNATPDDDNWSGQANSDCTLSEIKFTTGSLNKKFSARRTSYVLTLKKNKSSVKIIPVVKNKKATLTINERKAKAVTVSVRSKKSQKVKITVTAENGKKKSYTIVVKRK